jgi:hypothetical protein
MRRLTTRLAALEARTIPARSSESVPARLLVIAQAVAAHGAAMPGEGASQFDDWVTLLNHAGQLKRAGIIEIERTSP